MPNVTNESHEHCDVTFSHAYADFFLKHQKALSAQKKSLRDTFVKGYVRQCEHGEVKGFVETYIRRVEVTKPTVTLERRTEQLVKVRNREREKAQQLLDQIADKWERETRNVSPPKAISQHPLTDEIVKLGSDALPMILRRMESRPWFWFDVLRRLTKGKVNPVSPEMRGDVQQMTEAWIKWGVDSGVI